MWKILVQISLLIISGIYNRCFSNHLLWHRANSTVWLPVQTISGQLQDHSFISVTIYHDDTAFVVPVINGEFRFNCSMHNGVNRFWIKTDDAVHYPEPSDTLLLTMGYQLLPVVRPVATVLANKVMLYAKLFDNPLHKQLRYSWKQHAGNPSGTIIKKVNDSVASFIVPRVAGDYLFSVTVTGGSDSVSFSTAIRVNNKKDAVPFDINTDHASWIEKAIIYQVTPHHFVDSTTYDDIKAKLEELKFLGINTIYLQPLYQTKNGGQGYDITDYFSLRPEFGNETELQELITEAKKLKLRVLFDFVPNHTSIDHPYAIDCLARDTASPYYNFFQHTNDGAPYSSHYKQNGTFIGYFWKDLVNLNFNNNEVQQWILEACKYWVRKFDIDGYRFDAVWAVNARAPKFGKRLQQELKSIQPGLLLLAEDKGALSQVYNQGFDAAYDWTADTNWISQCSWQTNYDEHNSPTVFNYHDVKKRRDLLRQAMFDNGDSTHLRLRFIENNDLARFIKSHDLARSKMAAAWLFALPGIPMIYNGQEIGSDKHPYRRGAIFKKEKTIRSQDNFGLFDYYKKLTTLRSRYQSLYGGAMRELPLVNDVTVVAFRRWTGNEHTVVLVNLGDKPVNAELDISAILKASGAKVHFKDLLNEKLFSTATKNGRIKLPIEAYTTKILLKL